MRNLLILVSLATLLALAPSAAAQKADGLAGVYEVKYEEVASSCVNDAGLSLSRSTLAIAAKGGDKVGVRIPEMGNLPEMVGTAKSDRVKASAKGRLLGVEANLSIAGRVASGVVHFVFVVEYYKDKRPFCTQSWNVVGPRKEKLDGKGS
jgi:hypothetical protein